VVSILPSNLLAYRKESCLFWTDHTRSGHSLLNPPKPIDLTQARTASLALDLDLDLDDEEAVAERHLVSPQRTLVGVGRERGGYEPIFQDEEEAVETVRKAFGPQEGCGERRVGGGG